MAPTAFALPSCLLPSQAPFSTGSVFSAKHDTQRKKEQGAHKSWAGQTATAFEDTLACVPPAIEDGVLRLATRHAAALGMCSRGCCDPSACGGADPPSEVLTHWGCHPKGDIQLWVHTAHIRDTRFWKRKSCMKTEPAREGSHRLL